MLTWISKKRVTLISRLAECGNKQAIQAVSDHPNRVVSPSRVHPVDMHQVAPSSNRPVCNEVQQQITSVCDTSSDLASGRSQPTFGGSGPICFPTRSHFGQSGREIKRLHTQESHFDCSRVAQHALFLFFFFFFFFFYFSKSIIYKLQ